MLNKTLSVFILAICSSVGIVWGQSKNTKYLIACGDDKAIIINAEKSNEDYVDIVWRWSAGETLDLPKEYINLFTKMDECKPVENGKKLLLSASSSGVILLEKTTKKALFYAKAPNAHSAEYLPGNRIIVALSTAKNGNSIWLYDANKPNEVLFKDSLYSAHGVIWMPEHKRLYALGYNVLKAYSLKNWKTSTPSLQLENIWNLPDNGGHDISRISKDKLLITTSRKVTEFDIANSSFRPFEPLQNISNVKSANFVAKTEELIYTKGEIKWWTHHIYLKNPDKVFSIKDINLYKVRIYK